MRITNVFVYTEDHRFIPGTITIEDDRIVSVSDAQKDVNTYDMSKEDVIDGKGGYAIPGMIDLHFHGCKGYDLCDGTKEAIEEIAKYEASIGVTGIAPATMTLSVEDLEAVLKNAADFKKRQETEKIGADLLGINMEGPFISHVKKGAQDERNILPCDLSVYRRFQKAAEGLVKFIGVAPEESENACEFITAIKDEVSVSLAHTNADYDSAIRAIDAGANHAVHLCNAMPAFTHREPGVIGAVADRKKVMAEIICDGIHIHPAAVRGLFQMMGADRMILISDSIRAAGMPDGTYLLGGLDVIVKGKYATLASDGALAGSVTPLPDCVRTIVKQMGMPLETAIACATENPAKSLGVYDTYGSISVGKKANIVLWNKELELVSVIKDGKILRL